MYSYGRDFDDSSEIEDILLEFIMEKKRNRLKCADGDTYDLETNEECLVYQAGMDENICEEARYGYLPVGDERELADEMDKEYRKTLLSEKAGRLLSAVESVLDEMEYEGSPMYQDTVDRALISDLVEKACQRAMEMAPDIMSEEPLRRPVNQSDMGRALIELLLLQEIFGNRRPKKRRRPPYGCANCKW